MPNTNPTLDNQSMINFVLDVAKREAVVNVYPIGAITKELKGELISEMGEMARSGIKAVSNDGRPVMNSNIMRLALQYASAFNLLVISHPEDLNLSEDGLMNEGYYSTILGLKGIPSSSEEIMVVRDIILANELKTRIHLAHISTAISSDFIRMAKGKGIKVTSEVTPHHLALTEEACQSYDTDTKVNPPLRTRKDVEALKKALKEGVIDCIASDHAPHSKEEKESEYALAPFGISGIETSLGVVLTELVHKGGWKIEEVLSKMSYTPSRIIGIEGGQIRIGGIADLVIVDPHLNWKVEPDQFESKGKNTPFKGLELKGKAYYTIVRGRVVVREGRIVE